MIQVKLQEKENWKRERKARERRTSTLTATSPPFSTFPSLPTSPTPPFGGNPPPNSVSRLSLYLSPLLILLILRRAQTCFQLCRRRAFQSELMSESQWGLWCFFWCWAFCAFVLGRRREVILNTMSHHYRDLKVKSFTICSFIVAVAFGCVVAAETSRTTDLAHGGLRWDPL